MISSNLGIWEQQLLEICPVGPSCYHLQYLICTNVLVCCCQAGLRQLVSWDLDTEWAEFVQFYLRVGGDWAECNQADSREEGVLLQYSNDGGISWGLIAEMYFTDFTKPR